MAWRRSCSGARGRGGAAAAAHAAVAVDGGARTRAVEEVTRRRSGSARAVETERRCERVRHGVAEEGNGCGGAA
jgi:hypothetical protein